jgi:hypothetical protein
MILIWLYKVMIMIAIAGLHVSFMARSSFVPAGVVYPRSNIVSLLTEKNTGFFYSFSVTQVPDLSKFHTAANWHRH